MEKSRKHVKVIFDTSAYVAALLSKTGGSAAILEQVIEQQFFNFYTDEILVEIKKVLARPKFCLEKEKQDHFLHLIQECSFEVQQLKEFKMMINSYPWQNRSMRNTSFRSMKIEPKVLYSLMMEHTFYDKTECS